MVPSLLLSLFHFLPSLPPHLYFFPLIPSRLALSNKQQQQQQQQAQKTTMAEVTRRLYIYKRTVLSFTYTVTNNLAFGA
jgi:hypothetical protein